MRTIVIIALCVTVGSFDLLSRDSVDVSGARHLHMRTIPVQDPLGGREWRLDNPKLFSNMCGLDGADLIVGPSLFGPDYYFLLKNGSLVQDTSDRFRYRVSYYSQEYEADGSLPSEYITLYDVLRCSASGDTLFERDTFTVCDARVQNGLHADITGDGVNDIVYSFGSSFQIAIGARPTSLTCDSICVVPRIPNRHTQRPLVNDGSLYIVAHDTLGSPNGTLYYHRIRFDWHAALGQEGVAEFVDSIPPPIVGSTLFSSGTVHDQGAKQGYLWVMWIGPAGENQTVVYTFAGEKLSKITTIDQFLFSMSAVPGSSTDYKPILMYDISASRQAYLARIDELDRPFAQFNTGSGAIHVEGVLASDQNSDKLPEMVFFGKMGDTPLQYASFHYEYNRIDDPTSVRDSEIDDPTPMNISNGELVVRGLYEPYTIDAYNLLGSTVLPTINHTAPSTINIERLLSNLPQQRYFIVVRTAGAYWTLPYSK
ncbi:MAG TPA: hypothetical protein VK147_12720 [Candidatus Didemnitutus sp.]|nr:hypothetical protein [Candidatus Didemnitutus sp.]